MSRLLALGDSAHQDVEGTFNQGSLSSRDPLGQLVEQGGASRGHAVGDASSLLGQL
jgi:hypothetical protein